VRVAVERAAVGETKRTLALALLTLSGLLPVQGVAEEFEGTCAWALADRGVEKKTNCSVSWTDPGTGKTYCFSNEQTKMLFLQEPEENISRANDAFAKLRKKN
jgi:YHS domain-containing protein